MGQPVLCCVPYAIRTGSYEGNIIFLLLNPFIVIWCKFHQSLTTPDTSARYASNFTHCTDEKLQNIFLFIRFFLGEFYKVFIHYPFLCNRSRVHDCVGRWCGLRGRAPLELLLIDLSQAIPQWWRTHTSVSIPLTLQYSFLSLFLSLHVLILSVSSRL